MTCTNSDVYIAWSDIIEIRIHSPNPVLCASCYGRPFLPRIGPCGHVFCFTCIWVRIAFQHQDRKETCPVCERHLKRMELRRVRIFESYSPKVSDVVRFHHLTKNENSINLFALNHLSTAYRSHLLDAGENDFMNLLQKDIASMEKYKVDRQNAVKNGVLFLIAEDIVAFLRLYEESLLNNKTLCDDVTSTNCSTTHIRRNPKFYLELHGQDIFLHAFNRRCLQIEYGDSDMPKEISGKVTAVGRFTMDLTMRDVVRQLSHLPLGHIFYFVVLDFHGSVVGESTRSRMEYGWTLSKLSKRQVNVLEAVGYDVNDKLSLDLKRTDVYLADEFFSLPNAELQAFRRGISTQVPLLQRPVRWCIIELPSGSQAFFTEEMIQERLLEELQEHTQQKQTQSGHCQLNALQQQLLGLQRPSGRQMPLFLPPSEKGSRAIHIPRENRQRRCLQVPWEQSSFHYLHNPRKPKQLRKED